MSPLTYVDKANRVTFERRGDVIVMRNSHDILRLSPWELFAYK